MGLNNLSKNLLLLLISVTLSLLLLELMARKCLTLVGSNWHDASDWTKEMWLENHEHNPETTVYPIDRYDSLYGWTLKENLRHVMCNDWAVSSNSKGCRGEAEYSYQKTRKLRILTIGDSFTFGECVGDSDNFPAILATLLDSAEVINIGVHGYGQDQQLLKLMNEGQKYHPDVVRLGFLNDDINRNKINFRDFAKPYFVLSGDTLQLKGVPVSPPSVFMDAFRWKSWGLIKAKWAQLNEHSNDAANDIVTKKILEKIRSICKEINATLVVVYLPWSGECKENKSNHHPLFDSLVAMPGVFSVDPTTSIHSFLNNTRYPDSNFVCHYSPAVNRIIAVEIAGTVKKLNNSSPSKSIAP
ncbi:MAG: exported protein of unknown function [Bacteroidota bacterium]|nr:exported protein of unknown function [Bacteroidota bacterium]